MIRVFTILPALALTAGIAFAQDTAAPEAATTEAPAVSAQPDMGAAYESARNQLGVLKYCQAQGHIDGTAIEIQQKAMAPIPVGDVAKGDAAEEKGAAGTVSGMGAELSLADAATQQNTTVEALCKQMDAMLQQLSAQLPQ